MMQAVRAVVHENLSAADGFQMYQDIKASDKA